MDEEKEVEEYIQEQIQVIASQQGSFPEPAIKDNLLKFMRDVILQNDSIKLSKSANFKDEEVGSPKIPSLTYFHIADYADAEGHDVVADYLRDKVGSLAALSLGRRAKLLDSLFTVRRETRNLGTPKVTTQKALFSGEKKIEEGVL